jgi:transcriptional regulator with XRE-family HTH domain
MHSSPGHPPAVGDVLRWWRKRRGLSQMKLAHAAGVSPRHMSFLETGRSRPGRDVLIRLADTLDLPLRERNVLLESAGYARMYLESTLDASELERLRRILELILARYEPYGAVVVDAEWQVLMANRAHRRMAGRLLGEPLPEDDDAEANLLVQVFRPGGFRERLVNWPEVAHHMLERVRRQIAENPTRKSLRALLDRLESYGLPPDPGMPAGTLPVLPLHFAVDGAELRLVSLITTFGAPQDVSIQELRLEAFLPADAESDQLLSAFAGEDHDPWPSD